MILKDFNEISTIVCVKILITRGREDKEEGKIPPFPIPPAERFSQKPSLSIYETLGLNNKPESC